MNSKVIYFYIIAAVSLCFSCGGRSTSVGEQGDTLFLQHAELLRMVRCDDYVKVEVDNPWHPGKKLHTYYLVPASIADDIRQQLATQGTVVTVPLQRTVAFSTVHGNLVADMLGCESQLVGMADVEFVHAPRLKQLCQQGRVQHVGSSLSPNIEQLLTLHPDAILLSPFDNNGGYGKVGELGIPLIECADYMEETPIARAEWIKFYGLLFGEEQRADSLFHVVDSCYQKLVSLAAEAASCPTVLMDKMTGSVWYVPGGRSTMGTMLNDAHIRYVFADDTHSGSVALTFERVLAQAADASLWFLRYASHPEQGYALQTLRSEHLGYSQFAALRQGCCYGCDTRTSLFFDETPFRPDWLLRDFVTIAHPELQLGAPKYFLPIP